MTYDADLARFYAWTDRTTVGREIRAGVTTTCHTWLGSRTPGQQAQFWQGGRAHYAHVWLWERLRGPKPPGTQLSPLCGFPLCVNLDHREIRLRGQNRKAR